MQLNLHQHQTRCWSKSQASVRPRAPAAQPIRHLPAACDQLCSTRAAQEHIWPCAEDQGATAPSVQRLALPPTALSRAVSAAKTCITLLWSRGSTSLRQLQVAWRRYQHSNPGCSCGGPLLAMGAVAPGLSVPGADPWTELVTNRVFMTAFWAWFLAQFGKGVTTALALSQGLGSPLFAVALAFSAIVMYDAMGVRRHAGKHAEVLNQVINELMDDHPIGEVKLKEVLGHTPRQVLAGAVLGVVVGLLYPQVCVRLGNGL